MSGRPNKRIAVNKQQHRN